AAEDRLRSQTMLLAEAEHRLKTALAVITGWASTLDDRWDQLDDPRKREGLGIIRKAAEGMADQARQLLAEARAELRMLDLAPVALDLREVLALNVATFEGLSQTHRIIAATPASHDVWVDVDPAALQQVLGHLLENAVKYSPPGTTVSVGARRDGEDVVIDVVDEGPGVPEDVDVFAPFLRGPANGTEGAGLGLYIVRNLVRAMGGEIVALRNVAGPGSTFSVRLPA
ncbi:MAG TPA: HAMP domain-containing sensor histidine kinase, partial [Acidimicrobiales bacterium]|nr:HAMP domain-containing sensor histidine kinase [Acidimicrobiales bacterium]